MPARIIGLKTITLIGCTSVAITALTKFDGSSVTWTTADGKTPVVLVLEFSNRLNLGK